MKGYFRGISDERIMFDQCDRVETGDLGYYDGNKEIILVGRRDHMINLMGAKIHPIEIETIAMQIPQIKDARARLAGEDGAPIGPLGCCLLGQRLLHPGPSTALTEPTTTLCLHRRR